MPAPRAHLLAAGLSLLFAAACGGESGSDAPAVTVRDSAGIRIVENSGPAWGEGEGWRVASEPELIIGNDPELPLFEVGLIDLHEDGRLVVAHRGSNEVLTFSPEGSLLNRMGRSGEGPGEFGVLGSAFWYRGDSIAAQDISPEGLVVFDSNGELGRTQRGFDPLPVSGFGSPAIVRALEDGSFVRIEWGFRGAEPGDTLALRFARTDEKVSPQAPSPAFPGGTCASELRSGCGFGPFDSFTAFATSDTDFVFSFGGRYEVRRVSLDGRLRQIVRVEREPIPLNEESLAGYRAYLEKEQPGGWDSERLDDVLRETGMPSEMPAVGALILTTDGYLVAREFDAAQTSGFGPAWDSGPTLPWGVFDPGGQYLGRMQIPRQLTVSVIGPDFIIGVYRDEYDVETIRRYRVERR